MISLLNAFKAAPARPGPANLDMDRFKRLRWQTFLSMSLSYALFYVCRLSFNVVKPALVAHNLLSPAQLGIIGSALFFAYAIGKLVNGFLADHANVRRFMMLGLLLSALVNACMGLTTNTVILTLIWGLNGWAQSMGVGPCVVSLSRWYSDKERGTFYGFWSIAHSLGEALTYVAVAAVVVTWGWQYGYGLATLMGLAGLALIFFFMADSPQSCGFPPVHHEAQTPTPGDSPAPSIFSKQLALLKKPALWLLAMASCLMYIGRYAVISWGVFFLENAKAYNTLSASTLISITGVFGIIGTGLSGLISDRFFNGKRNALAMLFGLMNTLSLSAFLFVPAGHYWLDATAMLFFGLSMGALLCFLGGLMATDIAAKGAAGAALGMIGIASYAGAAAGEILTGVLIEHGTTVLSDGSKAYDFQTLSIFWVCASLVSVLMTALFALHLQQRRPPTLPKRKDSLVPVQP
ncbi:MFS transporter [Pseudomonas lundensis]|uniref:MFS transporter n=1 Tax=Pseudomonas lundensis TaxID=86185 RepID=UPI000BA20090|nr:MFS transporter [Pseudomonas lundensis]OZY52420.1 MFS transporter [Pseudomonas lundensis]